MPESPPETAPGMHHRLDTGDEVEPDDAGSVQFTLDGRPARGRPGEVVISAAERAGTYIPRFCYHPRMKPVGMCRMCLVEVKGPRGATLMPACYNAVADGMEISTRSDMAMSWVGGRRARALSLARSSANAKGLTR